MRSHHPSHNNIDLHMCKSTIPCFPGCRYPSYIFCHIPYLYSVHGWSDIFQQWCQNLYHAEIKPRDNFLRYFLYILLSQISFIGFKSCSFKVTPMAETRKAVQEIMKGKMVINQPVLLNTFHLFSDMICRTQRFSC